MGLRTCTTRSDPSVPATEGASGNDQEPSSRPASTSISHPVFPGQKLPAWGENHGFEKANRSTESDRTGQGATHHAGPRGTPERHPAGNNQGTWTGTSNNGHRGPQTRTAHTTRNELRHKNRCQAAPVAIEMDVCAPRSRPSPCRRRKRHRPDGRVRAWQRIQLLPATREPPSDATCACPEGTSPLRATKSPNDALQRQHSIPNAHTGEQEPSGPGHRTHNTQHNIPSEHTGEHEPSGRRHRAPNATCGAGTAVKTSGVAHDTAHVTQHAERRHR